MKNLINEKVGNIVAENFRTSKVLTAYHIDFCCGGGVTLAQACKDRNVAVENVLKELEEAFSSVEVKNYQRMELDELIDEIVNVHHKYVETTVPALQTYLNKLAQVHGERHPEIVEVRDEFYQAVIALGEHMRKEELILFPYVRAMVDARRNGFSLSKPHFVHVDHPIRKMEEDHVNEGARFKRIARLTDNYTYPSDGCQTYKVTMAMLQEFEDDLHTHIHLENNILFPAAKKMFEEFDFKNNEKNN